MKTRVSAIFVIYRNHLTFSSTTNDFLPLFARLSNNDVFYSPRFDFVRH